MIIRRKPATLGVLGTLCVPMCERDASVSSTREEADNMDTNHARWLADSLTPIQTNINTEHYI